MVGRRIVNTLTISPDPDTSGVGLHGDARGKNSTSKSSITQRRKSMVFSTIIFRTPSKRHIACENLIRPSPAMERLIGGTTNGTSHDMLTPVWLLFRTQT